VSDEIWSALEPPTIAGETGIGAALPSISNRFVDPPREKWQIAWNWLSEHTNPIVVKEARQAFNSRQFTIAFSLTLIAILFWTITAVVVQLPQLYYVPGGVTMLGGFMVILAFPLLLIIPFSAFRSMVIESEERTFELVSISALSAQQIVNGKMMSALLQTAVYLSTLTPCFVITYLLRGVLLSSILYYLVFTLLLSVVLTSLGILVATIGRAKILQVFASIVVLAALLIVFIYWSAFTVSTIEQWSMEGYGLIVVIALTSIVLAILPVFLRSATAAIDFPSENHATPLRIRLTLLVLTCLTWGIWSASEAEEIYVGYPFVIVGMFVFLIIGAFVVAERGILSPRAQRTLPRTVLGRVFMTWFYPGAGLGYVFLVCLFTSYLVAWAGLAVFNPGWSRGNASGQLVQMCIVCWAYFTFYNGLARLVMMAVPRIVTGRMVIGLLVQVLVVGAGVTLPFLVALIGSGFRPFNYSWHQFLNIPWTLIEMERTGIGSVVPSMILLALCALPVFGLNLILCGRDVLLVRMNLPQRLQQEINELAPSPAVVPDPFA
jgi:ABC-type transport system involved in multi-copper enzyme maturation permease subunit